MRSSKNIFFYKIKKPKKASQKTIADQFQNNQKFYHDGIPQKNAPFALKQEYQGITQLFSKIRKNKENTFFMVLIDSFFFIPSIFCFLGR